MAKEDLQDLRKNPSIINSYEPNSSKDYIYTDLNQYFNINENDDNSQTNDGAVMAFFDPSDEYYLDDIAIILLDKIAQKDGFLKEQNLDEYGLSNLILEDFKYDSKFQEQINFLKDEHNPKKCKKF